jgi:hypothetical protein
MLQSGEKKEERLHVTRKKGKDKAIIDRSNQVLVKVMNVFNQCNNPSRECLAMKEVSGC